MVLDAEITAMNGHKRKSLEILEAAGEGRKYTTDHTNKYPKVSYDTYYKGK